MPSRAARVAARGEVGADLRQAGSVERDRRLLAGRVRHAPTARPPATSRARRAAPARRLPTARGSTPCGRRGRAASPILIGALARTAASTRASAASLASRVEAEVAGGDAALGRDRGRLDDQQAGARQREMAEMDQVPVDRRAFARRVLAHRRDDDPVGEREAGRSSRGSKSWLMARREVIGDRCGAARIRRRDRSAAHDATALAVIVRDWPHSRTCRDDRVACAGLLCCCSARRSRAPPTIRRRSSATGSRATSASTPARSCPSCACT